MEILSVIHGGKVEEVSTSISLGILRVNSASCVEWLVNVSNIVDKKSESVRLCLLFIADMRLDGLIHEGVLVTFISEDPVDDSGDDLSNVFLIEFKVWVVVYGTALIKVGSINEVPSALPGAALCLDLVGKGGALNEWVLLFKVGEAGVCV